MWIRLKGKNTGSHGCKKTYNITLDIILRQYVKHISHKINCSFKNA
jgi:hypothetical protein